MTPTYINSACRCTHGMNDHDPDSLRCTKCSCDGLSMTSRVVDAPAGLANDDDFFNPVLDPSDFRLAWACESVQGPPGEMPLVHAVAESAGGAYIARITGTDPKWKWQRKFCRARLEERNGIQDLYVSYADLGFSWNPLSPSFWSDSSPEAVVLDIRYGPREILSAKRDGVDLPIIRDQCECGHEYIQHGVSRNVTSGCLALQGRNLGGQRCGCKKFTFKTGPEGATYKGKCTFRRFALITRTEAWKEVDELVVERVLAGTFDLKPVQTAQLGRIVGPARNPTLHSPRARISLDDGEVL